MVPGIRPIFDVEYFGLSVGRNRGYYETLIIPDNEIP